MSFEAVTWAMNVKVGDSTRKMVLVGLANHAHKDGRNSWASKETIADYAECSVKTVRRHVAQLLAEGWIREGDQQQVAHLRADRRPIVYDLAMNDHIRETWKHAAAEQRGDTLTPRPDDAQPAGQDTTGGQPVPPSTLHGGTPVTGRDGPTGGHTGGQPGPHGGTPVTPEPRTNQRTTPQPPASGGPDDATTTTNPAAASCARPGPTPHDNCRGCGTTNRQLEAQRKTDAEAARRRREQERLAAQRAEAERIRAAGRSPDIDQLLTDTRRQLARSTR